MDFVVLALMILGPAIVCMPIIAFFDKNRRKCCK